MAEPREIQVYFNNVYIRELFMNCTYKQTISQLLFQRFKIDNLININTIHFNAQKYIVQNEHKLTSYYQHSMKFEFLIDKRNVCINYLSLRVISNIDVDNNRQ